MATDCVERLADLQQDSLTQDALWRDSLSLTGHQRTFNGSATICTVWNELRKKCNPHNFRLLPDTAQVFSLGSKPAWVTAAFVFKTEGEGEQAAQCSGMLNMVPDDHGKYKIWLISTMMNTLDDPEGNGNPDSDPDPSFTPAASLDDGDEIDCVVVGGGMAGLCAAGRLHAMRIPYLVVETHNDVGDNWTKRYDSIHLHLSKHYSEMPFKRVYADQPYNLWSRHLADGMQKYVDTHNIQIWTSSSVTQARWDDSTRKWNVKVTKQGRFISLKAKHIIMAIGGGLDKPQYPEYSNRDSFKGTVLHTVQWKNANAMAGKKAIIIGSANSAIDIANDMVNAGVTDITIIQRSVTHVMSSTVLWPILDNLYNDDTDINLADKLIITPPYAATRLITMANAGAMQDRDPHRYDFLKRAGLRFHQSPDLFANIFERFGGHVLDHGQLSVIENEQVSFTCKSYYSSVAATQALKGQSHIKRPTHRLHPKRPPHVQRHRTARRHHHPRNRLPQQPPRQRNRDRRPRDR